jgi:multiple sugar transport system ATP-binding protein
LASVSFKNVNKVFGKDVKAVHDLSLDVKDGEFMVLVGPSGCGKTTALRIVAGLEEATSGDVQIGEKRVNDVPPKDRDIAMVFQNYALYPQMTVFDNMAFGLKLRNTPKSEIERRVNEVADMLELKPYLKRRPKELSGGQRQRVALGRAIVREPRVFLMDEPLSNLDAQLRVQTRAELSRVHQRIRRTTVYVTHDQVEAMTMGDRIVVMDRGVIQQVGAPQDLYDHPANQFVAGFIGSPAMNFFRNVRVERGDGFLNANVADQTLHLPNRVVDAVGNYLNRDVTLGLRPEDLTIANGSGGTNGIGQLRGTVDVVEHLGNEQLLYVKIANGVVLARVDPREVLKAGDAVTFNINDSKLHIFDPETTKALI